jgi:acetyl esterase/lipase
MFKITFTSLILQLALVCIAAAAERPKVEENGTIHVPAFKLPESTYLSEETRSILKHFRDHSAKEVTKALGGTCPSNEEAKVSDMPEIRQCRANAFYKTNIYKRMRKHHEVIIEPKVIAGVHTEQFIPDNGVSSKNKNKVLISLHAGAYMWGSRTYSHMESIPIASVGKIKVISIDYRMGPEYTFPAANDDVLAVYKELLKTYKPENIGIYGSSGGGMLVAQVIAQMQSEGLVLPAAIGLFFSGAPTALDEDRYKWGRSDTGYFTEALLGINWDKLFGPPHSYFKGVNRGGRIDSPGSYDDIMAKFPPTLLINGGARDFSLSMVLVTHAQLVRLGVEANLHMWEGMTHVFNHVPELQASKESYDVIVRFFDKYLGRELLMVNQVGS